MRGECSCAVLTLDPDSGKDCKINDTVSTTFSFLLTTTLPSLKTYLSYIFSEVDTLSPIRYIAVDDE